MDFVRTLFSLRYISIIAVISSFIGAVLLFVIGAMKILPDRPRTGKTGGPG
jgi:hypothetical protein